MDHYTSRWLHIILVHLEECTQCSGDMMGLVVSALIVQFSSNFFNLFILQEPVLFQVQIHYTFVFIVCFIFHNDLTPFKSLVHAICKIVVEKTYQK